MEEEIVTKATALFHVGLNERFTLVDALKASYPFNTLCRLFIIHRSSFRYWQTRPKRMRPKKLRLEVEVK
jgi:hypothetical protein